MTKKTMLIILLIFFFLASCGSNITYMLSNQYIPKAKEVSDQYGLDDASVSLSILQENSDPDKVIYGLKINSRKFSDLSDEQRYLYLYELNNLVADSKFKISPVVISGHVYQLSSNFEHAYTENNSAIFPYGTPTGIPPSKIVFNPPVEVELISNTKLDFLLAGDTVGYLIDYEKYSPRIDYDERVRLNQIYKKGYAYFINEGTTVLLLEVDGSFAKIQLIEGQSEKKAGNIGWIRISNIRSYPKP